LDEAGRRTFLAFVATFPFLGQRCERLQDRVLAGLADRWGW